MLYKYNDANGGNITCAWFDTLTHSTINRVLYNYVFYLNKRGNAHCTQYNMTYVLHIYNPYECYTSVHFRKSLWQCIMCSLR